MTSQKKALGFLLIGLISIGIANADFSTFPAQPGFVKFLRDGLSTDVQFDTVTPANTRALPVEVFTSGVSGVTANQGDPNSIDNAWPVQPTDGTNSQGYTASGEAKVSITSELPSGSNVIGGVTQSGTWNITDITGTVSLPAGAATEATLSAISGQLPASLGQKTMAESLACVLPSDQSAIPASQSGTWNIADIFGTISLPTGAATEAKQDAGNATLTSIDGKLAPLGQATMAASMPVAISSDQSAIPVTQSGTWNINNVSGIISLPTGAATEATLAAMNAKLPASLGQKTSAASMSVVLASDQVSVGAKLQDGSGNALTSQTAGTNRGIHTVDLGFSALSKARRDYSTGNVTTAAYTELLSSVGSSDVQEVEIFDSSGQTLVLAFGAASSEVDQIYIYPGGNARMRLRIPANTRLSIKAVSGTANAGEIVINLYG